MRLRSYMSFTYGTRTRARREQRREGREQREESRVRTETRSEREGNKRARGDAQTTRGVKNREKLEYGVAGQSPRRGVVERWMRGGQKQSQMRKQGHKKKGGKKRRRGERGG